MLQYLKIVVLQEYLQMMTVISEGKQLSKMVPADMPRNCESNKKRQKSCAKRPYIVINI